MKRLLSVLSVAVSLIIGCNCISTPQSDNYVAAVVELRRTNLSPGSTAEHILNDRINDYTRLITHTDAINVDIFVFPDGILNDDLNLPQKLPTASVSLPCGNLEISDSIAIQRLSCAARDSSKYIVTNMIGVFNSTNEIYNVNVVFNRLGELISVYRYSNQQSGTPNLSILDEPEIGYFDTDFGVRFGHLITRDLISLEPTRSLLNLGIKDFVFPNRWQTILPFLAGTQVQQAWSHTYSVNLLAAGQNEPNMGSTGSGIYSGRAGPLKIAISGSANFNGILLVSRISKTPGHIIGQIGEDGGIHPPIIQDLERITLTRNNLDDYLIAPIYLNGFGTRSICFDSFCCNMGYEVLIRNVAPNTVSYGYAFLMYRGNHHSTTEFAAGYVHACAIIACTNSSDPMTCGTRFPPGVTVDQQYVFNGIGLGGSFLNDTLPMASTLSTNLLPIDVSRFTYTESEPWLPTDGISRRNLSIAIHSNYREPFLTMGIYSHQSTGSTIQSFNRFGGLFIGVIVLIIKLI